MYVLLSKKYLHSFAVQHNHPRGSQNFQLQTIVNASFIIQYIFRTIQSEDVKNQYETDAQFAFN